MIHESNQPAVNEDQRAVTEYFASSRYQRTKTLGKFPERFVSNVDIEESHSLIVGICGLAALVLVFGAAMPIGLELLEAFLGVAMSFTVSAMVFQTLFLPPVVCFAFATVTPMFWCGSVFVRFALASLAVLPGSVACCALISILEPGDEDFWRIFFVVMFAYFMTTAAISLTVQLWSPWTMTHAREDLASTPATGTRSMLELTAITAIGCAVVASMEFEDVIEGVFFFSAFAVLATIAIISVLISILGAAQLTRKGIAIAVGTSFLASLFVSGFIAVAEYDWYALRDEFLLIGLVSLYGTALICGLMAVCLGWLRRCGWRCIHRHRPIKVDPLDA